MNGFEKIPYKNFAREPVCCNYIYSRIKEQEEKKAREIFVRNFCESTCNRERYTFLCVLRNKQYLILNGNKETGGKNASDVMMEQKVIVHLQFYRAHLINQLNRKKSLVHQHSLLRSRGFISYYIILIKVFILVCLLFGYFQLIHKCEN